MLGRKSRAKRTVAEDSWWGEDANFQTRQARDIQLAVRFLRPYGSLRALWIRAYKSRTLQNRCMISGKNYLAGVRLGWRCRVGRGQGTPANILSKYWNSVARLTVLRRCLSVRFPGGSSTRHSGRSVCFHTLSVSPAKREAWESKVAVPFSSVPCKKDSPYPLSLSPLCHPASSSLSGNVKKAVWINRLWSAPLGS